MKSAGTIAFRRIASAALAQSETITQRWLPSGRREGSEWVAINPTRADGRKGSFKVNLRTGKWGDFASNDRGGDLISLAAYLNRISNGEAALKVAEMLGMDAYEQ